MISPKEVLVGLVNDPDAIGRALAWCKSVSPAFPVGGSPLLVCRLLLLAGLEVPYAPAVAAQLKILRDFRWRYLKPQVEPLPGDVYAVEDPGENSLLMGIVAKRTVGFDGAWLLGVDPAVREPYRPRRVTASLSGSLRFGGWLTYG